MILYRSWRKGSAAVAAAFLGFVVAAPAAEAVGTPKLFTGAQAQKGAAVYAQDCAACHGANFQGVSAPAIAGTAFLNKSTALGWTVENFRHVVTTTMPRDNPGSLSDEQYADVLAYLLAADCYPVGDKPFPQKATPAINTAKMQAPDGAKPDDQALGTCKLHGKS